MHITGTSNMTGFSGSKMLSKGFNPSLALSMCGCQNDCQQLHMPSPHFSNSFIYLPMEDFHLEDTDQICFNHMPVPHPITMTGLDIHQPQLPGVWAVMIRSFNGIDLVWNDTELKLQILYCMSGWMVVSRVRIIRLILFWKYCTEWYL